MATSFTPTEDGRSPLRGSGHSAEPEPVCAVSAADAASTPNAVVRRTISPFATAPRDGTPFHILNTIRFNPLMERFEALSFYVDDPERKVWREHSFTEEPSVWLRRVPLPYEIPDGPWFPTATASYTCRPRRSFISRIIDRLFRRGPVPITLQWRYATAEWKPASDQSDSKGES